MSGDFLLVDDGDQAQLLGASEEGGEEGERTDQNEASNDNVIPVV